jgi:hypothetical protein
MIEQRSSQVEGLSTVDQPGNAKCMAFVASIHGQFASNRIKGMWNTFVLPAIFADRVLVFGAICGRMI